MPCLHGWRFAGLPVHRGEMHRSPSRKFYRSILPQPACHLTIRATPDQVYNLYTRIEFLPAWQEGVVSVQRTGPKRLHWVMQDPGTGKQFEFDSEETETVQGKRHVSRILNGPTAGTIEMFTVEEHPSGRGAVATLVLQFKLPGGIFTRSAAAIVSRSPAQIG